MADQIKIGNQHYPRMAVYGGVGIVLIAAVIYYRKKQQSNAAAASVTQAGTNEIDPATGYPYGSAEDAAALGTQDNYQSPSYYSGVGPSNGPGGNTVGSAYGGGFSSNAQWAQYVEQYEINTMGADPAVVGNAIGKYITGQPLTSDAMLSVVQSAIAIGGYPPVSGANGNPPAFVTAPNPPAVPPKPTPSKTFTPAGSISNLQASVKGTTATVVWNPSNNKGGYSYVLSDLHHVVIKKGSGTGVKSPLVFTGLHRGTTYNFGIQALPGGAGNNIHINIP